MCAWLFVDLDGLMDGTRAYPEKERSIGQGDTVSWVDQGVPEDGVMAMTWLLAIRDNLCCLHHCRSTLWTRGEVRRFRLVLLRTVESHAQLWGARSTTQHHTAPRSTTQHHPASPLPCTQRGVIFNGSAWQETTTNHLYYQHPIIVEKASTQSVYPHLTFLSFLPILFHTLMIVY